MGLRQRLADRLGRWRLAAAAVLWTEALARASWPAATVAGGFLAIAFLDLLPRLPGWLHAGLLITAALALLASLALGVRGLARPDAGGIDRRLERDGKLAHRPLDVLADRPIAGDAGLWQLHRKRAAASLSRLRLSPPSPDLPPRDPLALRIGVLLTLLASIAIGWGNLGPRLQAALTPQLHAGRTAEAGLDLWIKPPAYTGVAPIFLSADQPAANKDADRTVPVPAGSVLEAHVASGRSAPALRIRDSAQAPDPLPFDQLPGGGYALSRPLSEGSAIEIRQGWSSLGSWPIRIVADKPPIVGWTDMPQPNSERGTLQLPYAARDEYGVRTLSAEIRPVQPMGLPIEPFAAELPLPAAAKSPAGTASVDLTAHPAAGHEVTVVLAATDALEQRGVSEPQTVLLPERAFHHPTARALIAMRKYLLQEGMSVREKIAGAVAEQALQPQKYDDDLTVFLPLKSIANRLMRSDDPAVGLEAQQVLWDVAIQLEDRGMGDKEKRVKELEQALRDALADPNSDASKIADLARQLQQAMNELLQAMREQAQQQAERGELMELPEEFADQMLSDEDVQKMFEQMRQLAESGAREAAGAMLEQLRQMMEGMRPGGTTQPGERQRTQQALQAMRELRQLEQQQRQLMDETFQSTDRNGRPAPGQAQAQEQLRQKLGQTMQKLGESGMQTPDALGRAERAMRGAARSLERGDGEQGVAQQGEAVGALNEGNKETSQQLAEQLRKQRGMAMKRGGGRSPGTDPLGRQMPDQGNMADDGSVKIPGEAETRRVQEILKELRRRAGESDRPRAEREYIDRLLKQF